MRKSIKNKLLNRIIVLSLAGVLLIASTAVFIKNQNETTQPNRPNILVILTDQWDGRALGYLGKEKVKTPYLDAFAKESLTLTQMASNYPLCSPARAMLLTGTYAVKNGVISNSNSASAPSGVALREDAVCWSDILKAKGYSNGYIGKWHLDSPYQPYIPTKNNEGKVAWNEWTPASRRHGFDYWYAYNTYDEHERPMYWDTKAKRDDFHFVNQWGPEHEADKAIDFFSNKGNVRDTKNPFALVVSVNPPHSPYDRMPAGYLESYRDTPLDSMLTAPNIPAVGTPMGDLYRKEIKNYYANITGVDEQIGRIISALKEQKLLENTIVLIIADHGNCLGKHNEVSKNNIYEESIRIPFIIYWKDKIQPGIDNKLLASMPDVYPTLLDLAGLKGEIPASVDGKTYAPYFLNRTGKLPQEQYIMGNIPSNDVRINSGFRGIRTENYKLAYERRGEKLEGFLFDLKSDPYEINNLYRKNHPQIKRLTARLKDWIARTKDGFVLEGV